MPEVVENIADLGGLSRAWCGAQTRNRLQYDMKEAEEHTEDEQGED